MYARMHTWAQKPEEKLFLMELKKTCLVVNLQPSMLWYFEGVPNVEWRMQEGSRVGIFTPRHSILRSSESVIDYTFRLIFPSLGF